MPRTPIRTVVLAAVVLVAACSDGDTSIVETTTPSVATTATPSATEPVASTGSTSSTSSTAEVPSSSVAPTPGVSPSTEVETSTTSPPPLDPYEGSAAATPATGTVEDGWIETPDGRRRHYRLYVPSTLRAGEPTALLVALHGGLGSSEQFALNSGFDELAESNGFVVVYPDGIRATPDGPGYQTWNAGICCGPAVREGVDDVGFVRQLLDVVAASRPIDEDRVFAAGHSNGGILAYRLACELSDRIVAIGLQAGSLGIDECRPEQPVSVLHLHGVADTNHPIDGGVGATGVSGVSFRSGRASVRLLAELNGCDVEPVVERLVDDAAVEVTSWSGCEGGVEVRMMAVDGASHAWMGHAPSSPAAAALTGEPYPDLDASRAIWSFLAAHPRT